MINRQLPKEEFKFTLGSGQSMGVDDIDSLPPDHKEVVTNIYHNFLEGNKPKERQWRNDRLLETDWMLVPDATYKGLPLAGSQYLKEIIDYRNDLRSYNLTTDARPNPPAWY